MAIASHELRFLESITNLKPRVHMRFGHQPNTERAQEIVACLLQGRLFYEAAVTAPLEIRPLQLFYGMTGFAKALIVASRCRSLATLKGAHGLSDVSREGCRIADLQVKIEDSGTFQEFNDVIAEMTRFCYYDGFEYRTISTPAAYADALRGLKPNLRDLLGRIPELDGLYRKTFGEIGNTAAMHFEMGALGSCRICISDPQRFSNREELKVIVARWRSRFAFLAPWRIVEAVNSHDSSLFYLHNTSSHRDDEFAESVLIQYGTVFRASPQTLPGANCVFDPAIPPMAGGYTGVATFAIAPFDGRVLSGFAAHYLALFILSSLVRYRPQIWMHAISRSSTAQGVADDTALSLIERFLEVNSDVIPKMVITMLNPHEDPFFNPNTQTTC